MNTLDALGKSLSLTSKLPRRLRDLMPVTVSGGVSEYLFGRETIDYGDVGALIAEELRRAFRARLSVPIM